MAHHMPLRAQKHACSVIVVDSGTSVACVLDREDLIALLSQLNRTCFSNQRKSLLCVAYFKLLEREVNI